MNLPIIQSILHGALRPNFDLQIDYSTLAHQFEKLPNELPQIEKLFTQHLSNYADFNFEKPIPIADIAPDTYTRLSRSKLSKSFALQIAKPTNPKEKFYQTIVEAEIQRIKLTIFDYSEIQKSDIDNRQMIMEVLSQIIQYGLTVKVMPPLVSQESKHDYGISTGHLIISYDSTIWDNCRLQLTKFYVEVAALSDNLLTEVKDYLPFEDLIYKMFDKYPTDELNNLYKTFKECENNTSSKQPMEKQIAETSPEIQLLKTKYDAFIEAVKPYNFLELPKIKVLSLEKQQELIMNLVKSVPYAIAMIEFLEYPKHLKEKYEGMHTKEALYRHIAKALNVNHDTAKGQFLAYNNPDSLKAINYTSYQFIDEVKKDYENIVSK